ncbi:MAG: FAD-dependent oxidoreductase, partial [Janthinobacterium lividum]
GLVGSEMANDLTHTGYKVTVIDPLATPMAALLPPDVGIMLRDALEAQGVEWRLGQSAKSVNRGDGGYVLGLSDGSTVQADMVLSAVGLRSRTALAKEAGLEVHRGIKVDMRGRTSDPNVYAIGDCAEYPTGLAHFITPIMSAARSIAKSILSNPADIAFPVLSVIVKTTAMPISLLKPGEAVVGEWIKTEADGQGTVHLFKTADGLIAGYVLTGEKSEQRPEYDALVRTQLVA